MAARCSYFLHQLDSAREKLDRVLQFYPEYVDTHIWMGKLLYFEGEYTGAEKHLLKVLEEDSEHIRARYLLGDIYFYEGSFEKALMNYGIVEENLSIIALAKIRQGDIYARSKQYRMFREELSFIDRNRDMLDYHVLDEAYALLSGINMDE